MAGLLPERPAPARTAVSRSDLDLLHRMECRACPLDTGHGNRHPKMEPSGSDEPLVYLLGEAPGKHEDQQGIPFVGQSGQLLRARVPASLRRRVRYGNVVRTRPPGNRTPVPIEVECCRPSVRRDIEATRPRAIFGFGNIPLEWVSGMSGITLWRGRRMPVRVGSHTCWYYPMLHPSYVLRARRSGVEDPLDIGSEDERMFAMDLERAFAEVESLPEPVVHTPTDAWAGVEVISEGGRAGLAAVGEALEWAASQPLVGVDYETSCLRPYEHDARILSAAVGTSQFAVAFPFHHPEAQWSEADLWELERLWRTFLLDPRPVRAVHNLAFEHEWTAVKFGEDAVRAGTWSCTAVQASILDERRGRARPGPHALEWLVQQHFGFNLKQLAGLDRSNLVAAPLESVLYYNGMDAKYHALLWQVQDRRVAEDGLREAETLGQRRVPAVILSQVRGVPVDQEEVHSLQAKYEDLIADLRRQISELPVIRDYQKKNRQEFNPLSNPHVLHIFRDVLRRSECEVTDKKTKEKRYSADESVLAKIDHPLARLLLELRKANKRKSTYLDPMALDSPADRRVIFPDGLLHPQFNTFFAETGRLSAEGPNVQNYPKRHEEAAEVRRPVRPGDDRMILAFDYGQIEARVIAMFTRDRAFCRALWERYDVHMEWAERIARAYPDRIGGRQNLTDKKAMKDLRTDIKNQWTFPLFFGATVAAASGYLGIPESAVRPLYREFWKQFAGVREWQEEQVTQYEERGYVECLTGRRRRGPLSVNKVLNSPIQGTAAEIVMDAMCRLSETGDPELQPEINIHDDLTFLRVPVDRVDDVAEKVIGHMLAVPFEWVNVPIVVEMSMGPNWRDLEEVEGASEFSSDRWFGEYNLG